MASAFEKFLEKNLTVADLKSLDTIMGSKRMATIVKRDIRKITYPQLLEVAKLTMKADNAYTDEYLTQQFLKPAHLKSTTKRKSASPQGA